MRSQVLAIVLCIFTAIAAAQTEHPKQPAASQAVAEQHSGELIKSAGAQTHDGAPPVRAVHARHRDPDEHEHHTGPAMLLAALALMAGIALRRYSRDE